MSNIYNEYNWQKMLDRFSERKYSAKDIEKYFEILSPHPDYPEFIDKYLELPILKRLSGIGLLCGTDWTPLYKNKFYYSRLDHSKGVALIIWHFTHDKAQTIAGLLHDVSTPVFSHVSDFRKGDALTQTVTEAPNAAMIRADKALNDLLKQDELTVSQVEDYHKYPIADNEIPQLSADRLEYMYPSGMALDGSWTLEEIERTYNDIVVLKDENGMQELGFKTQEIAEEYCQHFCMIGHILQLNENKLALHLLGQIMNLAESENVLKEEDFMMLCEKEIIEKLENFIKLHESENAQKLEKTQKPENTKKSENTQKLISLYKTFRNMKEIIHSDIPMPEDEFFNVSLKVKQRYINPLVQQKNGKKAVRLAEISNNAKKYILDFQKYSDNTYGCVKFF